MALLHGFPDDARAYDLVGPLLAAAGCHAIAPYLRGYGPTRFLDPAAPRSGQQTALAQDLLDLLDALRLARVALVGYDWGGRAACIAAALRPEWVRCLVAIGGYLIQDTLHPSEPVHPTTERRLWYQWYFATERGRAGLARNRRALCRLLWATWSPTWRFGEEEFERTAGSFDNPDFVDVVLHSYRHRHGWAAGLPRYAAREAELASRPPIRVPTLVLHGAEDDLDVLENSEGQEHLFTAAYERRALPGVGHFPPREAPEVVAAAVLDLLSATA